MPNTYNLIIRLYDSNGNIIHRFSAKTDNLNFDVRITSLQNLFPETVRFQIDIIAVN